MKEDVLRALARSESRIDDMAPALVRHADDPLVDSEWTVREALCHVAARANAVPLANRIAQLMLAAQAEGQAPNFGGAGRATDINQAQLDERNDLTVAALLVEIHAGHQAAMAEVQAMPQETFDLRFPRVMGEGDMSLGDMILQAGSGHENNHLDHIERSLAQAPA
jgi:hypothetical protein